MDKSMKVIEICVYTALIIFFLFFGSKFVKKDHRTIEIPTQETTTKETIDLDRVQ